MNLGQLHDERDAAGAAYVEALNAFRAAFVRLAAIDRTLANQNVGAEQLRTFHFRRMQLEESLRSFQHHEYLPRLLVNDWHDAVTRASDRQIEEFKP